MLRVGTGFDTEISEDTEFTERGVAGLGLTGSGREGLDFHAAGCNPSRPDPRGRARWCGGAAPAGGPTSRSRHVWRSSREEGCSPGSSVRGYQNSNPEAELGPPLGFPSPWPSVPPCLRNARPSLAELVN